MKLTGNPPTAAGENQKIYIYIYIQEAIVNTGKFRVSFFNKTQIALGCFLKRLDLLCIAIRPCNKNSFKITTARCFGEPSLSLGVYRVYYISLVVHVIKQVKNPWFNVKFVTEQF